MISYPRRARIVNILLGAWLFVSAFVWPHSLAQFSNALLAGGGIASFALIALWAPQTRFLNTAAAVWLGLSAFALPTLSAATFVNSILVACAVFVVSFAGTAYNIDAHAH